MTLAQRAGGPRGDLVLGSTLDFKENPLEFVQYVARAYGDVAKFRVLFSEWHLVNHPDLIWEIFSKQQDVFLKPRVAHRLWKPFLGNSLLTAEGDRWRRLHTLMKPAVHRARIQAYTQTMVDYTQRMLTHWEEGTQRDVHEDFTQLTLEIICKNMFGADVTGDASFVYDAMCQVQQTMVDHIHMPLPVPRWWPSDTNRKKVGAIDGMQQIVSRYIAERREDPTDHGDLLSMLVMARDEEGNGLDDAEIHDQSMTLFFAGHETTANTLTWTWFLLAKHPDVVDRLTAEIDAATGGAPPTLASLKDMPYLDMCLKESMRILPSVWVFMKEPVRDAQLGDYTIPKGAPVMISPYVTHRDPRFWERPQSFLPERFSKERIGRIPRGAYIPFSGGKRVCFGKSFALAEARLVLATMLQQVRPRVPDGHMPAKVAELSMHPRGGMPVIVERRETSV